MFEYVRSHQKLLQTILLLLILPSFVVVGVRSYMGSDGKATDIAKIGNEFISGPEFDNALKNQAQRAGLPPAIVNSSSFKNNVLNQLIQQKLLENEMQSLGLQVSDERLARELIRFPEIQALKKSDGSIDSDRYRQLLQMNGLTVAQFEAIKKAEIMSADLQNAIASNQQGITSEIVSNHVMDAYAMEREVQALFFLGSEFTKGVKLEDQDLQDYYQAHPSEFQTIPTADIDYLILSKDSKMDIKDYAKLADNFANLVYEQSESLQPAADIVKAVIQHQNGLSYAGIASFPNSHPLNQEKVLKAIFSDEVLNSGKNSDAIQLPNGELIAVHVKNYHPAKTEEFSVVKSKIQNIVTAKKAEDLAVAAGNSFEERINSDPKYSLEGKTFSKSLWISRLQPLDLKGEPFEKVFAVDPDKLPQVVSAKIPGGVAVYRINAIRKPQNLDPKVRIEQYKQIADLNFQNELGAYFANMRDRVKVKILRSMQ
jgi:parvulin-like peptidyl-prolyl isomerase